MMTNAQIKTLLQNNFNADVMLHAQVFLSNLIERKKYGGGVERYRVFDSVSNGYVTSLSDLISKIDANSLSLEYDFNRAKDDSLPLPSTRVILGNFVVKLSLYTEEDNVYLEKYGYRENGSKIMVRLSYVDVDTSLPLKISSVSLV